MTSRELLFSLCALFAFLACMTLSIELNQAQRELRAFKEGLRLKASWVIQEGRMVPVVEAQR